VWVNMDVKFVEDQPKSTEKPAKTGQIDLLRRIFIPIERRTAEGTLVFKTSDKEMYARLDDGSIRRTTPKQRGKAARRADKAARRK